jgi:N-acetylneuraminate synthase
MDWIEIANRRVGHGYPCFIIAEAGVNHNGDVELAKRLVKLAVEAGADAVKFQTFKAERVVSAEAPKAEYQVQSTDPNESHLEMLRRLELRPEAHRELETFCSELCTLFISTPFDEQSADLLDELGVAAIKISSGDISNWPLLEYVARKRKPIILSTGMSYLGEVDEAVRVIQRAGNDQVILMHCVSNYPAEPSDANLKAMHTMRTAFQLPVGYSDHTRGIEVALGAVALGACVIEKHFTLDRSMSGPDHHASLEPDELVALVSGIRIVEESLGDARKEPAASELSTAAVVRKSLVAARDIPAGTALTEELISIKRPGTGLPPGMLTSLVGRIARTPIRAGTLFTLDMLK